MTVDRITTVLAMAQPPGGSPSLMAQLLPFVAILAIFYFVILLPMRRRQRKVQEFQANLKVGDKVVTTSGIYGAITKMGERSVQVQVADRVRIEVSRAAIGGYQGQAPVVPEQGG
ncbi:MAG: preprotein translocase subunit YajC [Acidobacteria bacterium]|nr:preprotein translocase subunit YajC [Acidobacteriota bacterium]